MTHSLRVFAGCYETDRGKTIAATPERAHCRAPFASSDRHWPESFGVVRVHGRSSASYMEHENASNQFVSEFADEELRLPEEHNCTFLF